MKKVLSLPILIAVLCLLLWQASQSMVLRQWSIHGGSAVMSQSVEKILKSLYGESLLTLDLSLLQMRIAALPSVAGVAIRRRLPDSITIDLIDHRPLAVWSSGGLVDVLGIRYDGNVDTWLPIFQGEEGHAAQLADFYSTAREILMAVKTVIIQLQVDQDGETRLFLQEGTILHLGRENRHQRLRRYVRNIDILKQQLDDIRAVDLRYERGFAVIREKEQL